MPQNKQTVDRMRFFCYTIRIHIVCNKIRNLLVFICQLHTIQRKKNEKENTVF